MGIFSGMKIHLAMCIFLLHVLLFQAFGQIPDSIDAVIRNSKDPREVIDAQIWAARYMKGFDLQQAEKLINQAKERSEELNYQKGLTDCYFFLAEFYSDVSIEFSLEMINKAEDIFQQTGDTLMLMGILMQKGNIYNTHFHHLKAIDFYQQRLKLALEYGDSTQLQATIANIGMIHAYLQQYDSALFYFYQAKDIDHKYRFPRFQSTILGNIAAVYLNVGENDSARLFYYRCRAMDLDQKNFFKLGWLENVYSNIHRNEGNIDSALHFAYNGLNYGLKYNNPDAVEYSYKNLTKLYSILQKSDSASRYLDLMYDIKDSLLKKNEMRTLDLTFLKKDMENNLAIQKIKARQTKVRLALSIAILGLLLVVLMVSYYAMNLKRRRHMLESKLLLMEKERLEETIASSNRRISTHMMNIISKNNMIENLIKKLANHPVGFKKENQPLINEVISELKMNLNADVWEEFEMRFGEVHPSFYDRLKNTFPNLTPTELRLCAFLKMNMTTKEIAIVLHMNVKSVEKARIRLRKKLEISNTDANLNDFIMQF